MKEYIYSFAESFYGKSIIGGMIGAVIHRFYNKMSITEFLSSVVVSGFVGLIAGILLKDYTNFSTEVVYVGVALAGNFAKYLLEEIKQVISSFSDVIITRLKG